MQRRDFILGAAGLVGLAAAGTLYKYPWEALGADAEGERLKRILASPHYYSGEFQSLEPAPTMVSGKNPLTATLKFITGEGRAADVAPSEPLPLIRTDLKALDKNENLVVWLGHSSFYMQLGGRRILFDPVLSDYASPVFFINRAFPTTEAFSPGDFPELDLVLLSHDHWDHMDYPTLLALRDRIKCFITPLGVGAHLEKWGFAPEMIHEGDWFDEFTPFEEKDFRVTVLPSQHFSGRTLKRNQTEWSGFALTSRAGNVYYSGDGGYGSHFKEIGRCFPAGFDLALMEDGQYNEDWAKIHMMPEESVRAAVEVGAKAALPMHLGKFALARHSWKEPLERFTAAAKEAALPCHTPRMGEPIKIGQSPAASPWWKDLT